MRILIFGDSIAYGAVDHDKGGWVQRLKSFFLEESNGEISVYNCSISGDKTEDLLQRFKVEAAAREADIIIFAIGTNDSRYLKTKSSLQTKPVDFRKDIIKLIKEAKKLTKKIVFISIGPFDERAEPIPWDPIKFYTTELARQNNKIIKELCKKNSLLYIDIISDWLEREYRSLLADGLHPNSKGHELVFKAVRDFLIKNKLVKIS